MAPPRFAADVMLGKLARWLRLLGFDTYYSNRAEDDFLKEFSEREDRILLTRDLLLHKRMAEGTSHLVAACLPREQVVEVVGRFQLQKFSLPPRCSVCNGGLEIVEKAALTGIVPPYVFKTQTDFSRCRDCAKIYWPGTHLPKIKLFLSRAASPTTKH